MSISEYDQSESNQIEEETVTQEYPKIPHVNHTGLKGNERYHGRALIGNEQHERYAFTDNLRKEVYDDYTPVQSTTWKYNQMTVDRMIESRIKTVSRYTSQAKKSTQCIDKRNNGMTFQLRNLEPNALL